MTRGTRTKPRRIGRVAVTLICGALVTALADRPGGGRHVTGGGPGAGINVAAGTVTTASGKVIDGITFVKSRDVAALRQQQRKALATAPAGVTGTRHCLEEWHFIAGGGANTNWKPDATTHIFGNGNRNSDYWNQEFLPCWWTDWTEPNSWSLLSNRTGLMMYSLDTSLYANVPITAGWAPWTKFLVCHYDGNWTYLSVLVGGINLFAYRDPSTGQMLQNTGPLTGNHLLRVDPPITEDFC